jgi:protein-S-isoprenylcysteine O-methyltransferase Ste14
MQTLTQVIQPLGVLITISGLLIDIIWYNFWGSNYNGELLTEGPYKYVRHPFYTGFLLMSIGLTFAVPIFETRLLLVLTLAVLVVFIPKEEEELKRKYQKKYGEYMKKVPWRLIPYIY